MLKRQNRVAQYIVTQPILDLCEKTVRMLGTWVEKRWWEQEGLDLAGVRAPKWKIRGEKSRSSGELKSWTNKVATNL